MVLVPLKGECVRFVFLIVGVKAVHIIFNISRAKKSIEKKDAEKEYRVYLQECCKGGDPGKYHQEYAGAVHRATGVRQLQEY